MYAKNRIGKSEPSNEITITADEAGRWHWLEPATQQSTLVIQTLKCRIESCLSLLLMAFFNVNFHGPIPYIMPTTLCPSFEIILAIQMVKVLNIEV